MGIQASGTWIPVLLVAVCFNSRLWQINRPQGCGGRSDMLKASLSTLEFHP